MALLDELKAKNEQTKEVKEQAKEIEAIKANQQQIMKTLQAIQNELKNQSVAGNESIGAECEKAISDVQKEVIGFKEEAGKVLYQIKSKADEVSQSVWASKALLLGLLVISLGVNFGVGWSVYSNTNQMKDSYAATTAILSEESHYWFDGENFQISRKAPVQKDLENALKVYKQRQEQAAKK